MGDTSQYLFIGGWKNFSQKKPSLGRLETHSLETVCNYFFIFSCHRIRPYRTHT
jgi:hypothetical protein